MTNDPVGRIPCIRAADSGGVPEDSADISASLRQDVSLTATTAEYGENISGAPSANSAPRRITPLSASVFFLRIALSVVFLAAAYFELMSAIGSFIPNCVNALSCLAFGGSYAIEENSAPHVGDVMRPPKPDIEMIEFGDGSEDWSGDSGTESEGGEAEGGAGDEAGGERYPIKATDISTNAERGLACSNQTGYELDLPLLADSEFVLPPLEELKALHPDDPDAPVVLIIHTHGTESFSPEGSDSYGLKDSFRSKDITQNVVAVGSVIAEQLESRGIPTLHCTEMFDKDSYSKAYSNSSAAVREYIAIYPSIKYVFDVHRDSIIASDYTKYRPMTVIDGVETAQVMILIGTDARGSDHPNWRDNLTLASHLQERLFSRSQSFPRKMSVRTGAFYQQYAPGSLLFEIGSCGNTLSQAKAAAKLLAEELAEIIIKGE